MRHKTKTKINLNKIKNSKHNSWKKEKKNRWSWRETKRTKQKHKQDQDKTSRLTERNGSTFEDLPDDSDKDWISSSVYTWFIKQAQNNYSKFRDVKWTRQQYTSKNHALLVIWKSRFNYLHDWVYKIKVILMCGQFIMNVNRIEWVEMD